MKKTDLFRGASVAMITLYEASGAVDGRAMARYGTWLLENGAAGLLVFGTTGEGPSLSVAERCEALSAMIRHGIPPERIVMGALGTAVTDVSALVAAAGTAKCAGALVMPPFYFRSATGEGLADFFHTVLDATQDLSTGILLYHFPEMSGIENPIPIVEGLLQRRDNRLIGIKDSAGQPARTLEWIRAYGQRLEIYTGDDDQMDVVLKAGGGGSMTAAAGLVPGLAASIARDGGQGGADMQERLLTRLWCDVLLKTDVIAAIRTVLASYSGDPAWLWMRAPLRPMPAEEARRLIDAVSALGGVLQTHLSRLPTLSP